ncbi:MAG: efflux RND transporter periplasmic adaptor subunit [Gammaproteobacteria bacterium]|nr:efflux RND transporter periplasmic adaptor subunit [Gammaproteobacteria bacterium]
MTATGSGTRPLPRFAAWFRGLSFSGRAGTSFGVLFALLVIIAGLDGDRGPGPGLESAAVEPGSIHLEVRATGHLRARGQLPVFAQVSGIIREVLTGSSGRVESGEVLAIVDDRDYRLALQEADAQRVAAQSETAGVRARLVQAQQEHDRAERLYREDLIPRQELEKAAAARQELEAQQAMAEARVRQALLREQQARENLGRCTVRSPIGGVLLTVGAEPGEPVAGVGGKPLFQLAPSLDQIEIRVAVTESDIGKVRIGQPVRFSVEAYGGEEFGGEVSAIRRGGEDRGGVTYYEVLVSAGNPGHRLLPGMTAQVRVDAGTREVARLIPLRALLYNPEAEVLERWQSEVDRIRQAGDTLVWVNGESGVRPVGVQLGVQDREQVEVMGEWSNPENQVVYRQ